jgi:hypothetical protein
VVPGQVVQGLPQGNLTTMPKCYSIWSCCLTACQY